MGLFDHKSKCNIGNVKHDNKKLSRHVFSKACQLHLCADCGRNSETSSWECERCGDGNHTYCYFLDK